MALLHLKLAFENCMGILVPPRGRSIASWINLLSNVLQVIAFWASVCQFVHHLLQGDPSVSDA